MRNKFNMISKMYFIKLFFALLFFLICILFIEGANSLFKKSEMHNSISYNLISNFAHSDNKIDINDYQHDNVIYDERILIDFIDEIDSLNGYFGNVPFDYNAKHSLIKNNGSCTVFNENLSMESYFIRTDLYNSFDPVTIWVDKNKMKSDELISLLNKYSSGQSSFHTNELGHRNVTSTISSNDVINIYTGGGAALSSVLSDHLTIPSILQNSDPDSKYLNFSSLSNDISNIICNLDEQLKSSNSKINNLILLVSDMELLELNDEGLKGFISQLNSVKNEYLIENVIVIYFPYIYTVSPELTIRKGGSSTSFPDAKSKKDILLRESNKNNFKTIDLTEIINSNIIQEGSLMNVFENYNHHGHPSYLLNLKISKLLDSELVK